MNKALCSMLTSYFEYQRDMGIDDIVFSQDTDVHTILTGNSKRVVSTVSTQNNATAAPQAGGAWGKLYGGGTSAIKPPTVGAAATAPASVPPPPASGLAKLAKLKTVDALDIREPIRTSSRQPPACGVAAGAQSPAAGAGVKREKMAALYREAQRCDKCAAARSRNKLVIGTGCVDGRLLIVGGAPSKFDDTVGLPFQGDTGELLNKMLLKMGLDKGVDVFVTYLQKCYAGGGNDNSGDLNLFCDNAAARAGGQPEHGFDREYAVVCKSILDKQIEIIAPKAILIFDRAAANVILENENDIETLRGANHIYKGAPVVVTYGLTLMLDDPKYRYGAWDDLKRVLQYLG